MAIRKMGKMMNRNAVIGGLGAAVLLATPIIARWEGFRPDPYRDIVGVWTVCYGETRVDMRRYSVAECEAMLRGAVGEYATGVVGCVPALRNRPHQLAASTSLAYNVGVAQFCRSTAARKFNAGDWRGGCQALSLYVYAGGQRVQGLANRRADEVKLCMVGL